MRVCVVLAALTLECVLPNVTGRVLVVVVVVVVGLGLGMAEQHILPERRLG